VSVPKLFLVVRCPPMSQQCTSTDALGRIPALMGLKATEEDGAAAIAADEFSLGTRLAGNQL
jgi:hypothetical protein